MALIGQPAVEALRAYLADGRQRLLAEGQGSGGTVRAKRSRKTDALFLNRFGQRLSVSMFTRTLERLCRRGRHRAPGDAAHAAPQLRHASAGRRRRPALGAGVAGPRAGQHDADLHPGQPGPAQGDGAEGASEGKEDWQAVRSASAVTICHSDSRSLMPIRLPSRLAGCGPACRNRRRCAAGQPAGEPRLPQRFHRLVRLAADLGRPGAHRHRFPLFRAGRAGMPWLRAWSRSLTTFADVLPEMVAGGGVRRLAFEADHATFADVQDWAKAVP